MTYIEISTNDNCLFLFEVVAIFLEALIIIIDSILKSIKFLSSVGNISSDQVKIFKFACYDSSLLGVFFLG
jgi:hypothetical protein